MQPSPVILSTNVHDRRQMYDHGSEIFFSMKSNLTCIQTSRFEEEERMHKYLQGQRRQGLDKVKWTMDYYLALPLSCELTQASGYDFFSVEHLPKY